ncbi:MAG: hypothetical protein KF729_31915 [Sandaracinaceae bacterium]|nr:hypothetical protein [Sandaracinaceae bacterium]
MAEAATHLAISARLVGTPVAIGDGIASARLVTSAEMAADDRGLVHGGFVFGLADYAAMLAVNDPLVVLGAADVRFTAPVAVGDEVLARATVTEAKGKKRVVAVSASVADRVVLEGTLTAFVLEQHVLSRG